jgi:hypothetical protein
MMMTDEGEETIEVSKKVLRTRTLDGFGEELARAL